MMADIASTVTTGELAARLSGALEGPSDLSIAGVSGLEEAVESDITFIADAAHAGRWSDARAGAAVVSEGLQVVGHDAERRALIIVPSAELAMIELLKLFAPPAAQPELGIHPTAVVHPDAALGSDVRIGPYTTIDRGAVIGDRVVLHAGVRIYADVTIGDDTVVHANSVIRERCCLGTRVLMHQNVSIGADGFGYRPAPDGSGVLKVPHIGTVQIGDDVEIGAGTCIDRGKFGPTVIGDGTKIDNLCQIAHNCRIGRGCILAGLTGLSGSVTIEDGAVLAGNVGVADHRRIGAGAVLGAKSGVMHDVPPGDTWMGLPAQPAKTLFRQAAALKRLPELLRLARKEFPSGKDLK